MANELRILTADDGYVYTNGETYGGIIYLGNLDSPANWWQIPEDEVPEETPQESPADSEENPSELDEDTLTYAEVARILLDGE